MNIKQLSKEELYHLYGKIRYIVALNGCDKLSADDVRHKITDKHYALIKELYNFNKRDIKFIIDSLYPPSENSTSFKGARQRGGNMTRAATCTHKGGGQSGTEES